MIVPCYFLMVGIYHLGLQLQLSFLFMSRVGSQTQCLEHCG
jgi:hypothetical protein